MDKYKQLMCVKGLIISMDEQLYRNDAIKKEGLNMDAEIIDSYYKSINEFLKTHEGTE